MRETRTDTVRAPDAPAAAVALTGHMALTASARSVGDTLRQEVLVDGRHRLVTDEPERLGGTDAGPAPHELLPAALAACIATTIRRYARTKGWALGELSVDVVYDNTSTPRRFDVTIDLPAGLSPVQVHRLMRVAEACPLRRSIEAGMVFDEHLRGERGAA
jgi:putative redox protein